ncbi:MAG: hypothetical protein CVU56_14390 [Deltaproteobacteria bacterium HGW-Deltaproteobacteria-14]|jgi:acyl-CoA thioesterase FadM|nr:MAG: hypothetical protein CVU56_14390 [Deltaproteobacteria bacterium HGW-Deltaproteobacteria-14]
MSANETALPLGDLLMRPFEERLVTRGYETDYTGTIPMPIVFRFFEHKRWLMMRDPRLGIIDHVHAGHFFVVREQTIEILRHLGQGVALVIRTRFDQAGRSTLGVSHELLRASDGALVARAHVTGVWIGPNRRMVRLPDHLRDVARAQAAELRAHPPTPHRPTAQPHDRGLATSFFEPPEVVHPGLGLDVTPPAGPPPPGAFTHDVVVPPRELDIFSHVNAATWLAYCDDARHAGAAAGAFPAELGHGGYNVRSVILYKREAVVGDRLTVHAWRIAGDDRAVAFAILRRGDPDPLCVTRIDTEPGAGAISPPLSGI